MSQRCQRVGEQIHKEVSTMLTYGLKDPRVGFVTITGVEVTPDLGMARIYYTVMGDEESRRQTGEGLKSSTSYVRKQLSRLLHLRHTPDILFVYDESFDYGQRIESLLRDVKPGDEDV